MRMRKRTLFAQCHSLRKRFVCFSWGRVNFLLSSCHKAGFWNCTENSVDKAGIFLLVLSSSCTDPRSFLLFVRRLGCTMNWEGTWLGQLTSSVPRDIPYPVASCPAVGRRRGKDMFRGMAFVFPCLCYMWWSPGLLELSQQLPACGMWWINSFFCFASAHGFCFTC